MNIVVTGGRDFKDRELVFEVLGNFCHTELFVGDATGVDAAAREYWGSEANIFLADWDKHGKAAGPIRNLTMLKAAGQDALVIAFPGGKGTENCVKQAKELGMVVLRVEV